jgi:hypothetical protein
MLAQATKEAQAEIKKRGLVGILENIRQAKELETETTFNEFIAKQPVVSEVKASYQLSELDSAEREKLAADFQDGNFLFHSTGVERAIEILQTGAIKNSLALSKDKEWNSFNNNSGFEGISWNFNQIEAMPGDRYHVVGFVSNLENVLTNQSKLTIPSRPAPYELIQVGENLDVQRFYDDKIQSELYFSYDIYGEMNSILASLFNIGHNIDHPDTLFPSKILTALNEKTELFEQEENYDRYYQLGEQGEVKLAPELLQQTEVLVLLVYLRALIKSGQIEQMPGFQANDSLKQVVTKIASKEHHSNFCTFFFAQLKKMEKQTQVFDSQVTPLAQPTSKLYFVCPDHDQEKWREVLRRCKEQPKGVLVYDGERVRLENFASRHSGDHNQMTQIIKEAIGTDPNNEQYLDYERYFLHKEVGQVKRAGHRHQVISETEIKSRPVLSLKGLEN